MYIRILTYNFYCRPSFNFWDNQNERINNIAENITNYENNKGYKIDVILFQEIFDNRVKRKLKKQMKKIGFIYRSKRVGARFRLNGGIITYSRFPILEEKKMIYKKSQIFNAISAKGLMYTKIFMYNKFYHIFNTHLDSFSNKIRISQMKDMKNFINKLDIPENDSIIIGGDWNIDANRSGINNISKIFNDYNMAETLEDEYTYDGKNNSWIERHDYNNKDTQELLDFFICKIPKLKYKEDFEEKSTIEEEYMSEEYKEFKNIPLSMKVLKFKHKSKAHNIIYATSFHLNFHTLTKKYNVNDLSDHYAGLCEFCI